MDGGRRGPEAVAYAEGVVYSAGLRSVVTDRWQLLYDVRTRTGRLYDLAPGADARADRAAAEPAVAARLTRLARRHVRRMAARRVAPLERPLSDETRRKLVELGYVEEATPPR
jgi:hypothetical protein